MKSEKHTRIELIGIQLKQSGWDVNDRSQVIVEHGTKVELPDGFKDPQSPYRGHLYCDYVLLGRDGKILAVVEAKKTSVDAAIGREQAKQYCCDIKEKQPPLGAGFCEAKPKQSYTPTRFLLSSTPLIQTARFPGLLRHS